jgi:hypothetical protein
MRGSWAAELLDIESQIFAAYRDHHLKLAHQS